MNPILLIAIPLFAAFLAVIFKKHDKLIMAAAVGFNTIYTIISAILYSNPVIYEIGGFRPPFGISLVLDAYSMTGIVILNIVFVLIVLLSYKTIAKYSVVMVVFLAALNGLILTGDLFNLFVFLEIAAISAYIMSSMNKEYKHTFNYVILGSLASGLYLFGIIIMYNIFGTLNIADIKGMIDSTSYSLIGVMTLPVILIFAGISVEAKLMPFSGWVKGVLRKSNGLVGTLLLSAYATSIIFVFGRLLNTVLVFSNEMKIIFTAIALITLVLAEFAALSKKNIREILLFSSIAQSGLMIFLLIGGYTGLA